MSTNTGQSGEYIYLNSGQSGIIPDTVMQQITDAFDFERKYGSSSPIIQSKKEQTYVEARQSLATMLHADPDEMVLTQNTTEGINIVLYGLDLQAGDEVIITNHEHYSALVPLINLQNEVGVSIKILNLEKFTSETGEWNEAGLRVELDRLVTGKTKLILMSHILYTTGMTMPVAEITRYMHKHSVAVLIDGAQAVGHIPVNVRELGCDFYAFTGGKWLNGPAGTGGLFILKQWTSVLKHTYSGYLSVCAPDNLSFKRGGGGYEVSTKNIPLLCGLIAAVRDFTDRQYERNQKVTVLASRIRSALAKCRGVSILNSLSLNGILTFSHQQMKAEEIYEALIAERMIARTIEPLKAVRLTIPHYLTEEQVGRIICVLNNTFSVKGRL